MTDDIEILLDRASSAPLRAFDADDIVARGRAGLRRRRIGLGGAAAAGVAAVSVAALALTSTLGAGTSPRSGVGGQPGPAYTLPELDPDTAYYWHSRDRQDDAASARLTEALVGHFAANLPQAKVVAYGPDFQPDGSTYRTRLVSPGAPDSPLRVSRYTNELVAARGTGSVADGTVQDGEWPTFTPVDPPEPVHEQPVYRLRESAAVQVEDDTAFTLNHLAGTEVAFDGSGKDQTDLLRIALFPTGGYRAGYDPAQIGAREPSDGYLVEGCETYDVTSAHQGTADDRRFSFDCRESTGPSGERVVSVAAHETYVSAGATFTINTVVVRRTDGTALVVSDTPQPGLDWKQGRDRVPGQPALTLGELTRLALALPLVAVA
jgi:hypothetical protein